MYHMVQYAAEKRKRLAGGHLMVIASRSDPEHRRDFTSASRSCGVTSSKERVTIRFPAQLPLGYRVGATRHSPRLAGTTLPISSPGVARKFEVARLPVAEGPVLAFVLGHDHREVLGSHPGALG